MQIKSLHNRIKEYRRFGGKDVFNTHEKTLDYGCKQPIGTT